MESGNKKGAPANERVPIRFNSPKMDASFASASLSCWAFRAIPSLVAFDNTPSPSPLSGWRSGLEHRSRTSSGALTRLNASAASRLSRARRDATADSKSVGAGWVGGKSSIGDLVEWVIAVPSLAAAFASGVSLSPRRAARAAEARSRGVLGGVSHTCITVGAMRTAITAGHSGSAFDVRRIARPGRVARRTAIGNCLVRCTTIAWWSKGCPATVVVSVL